jgi:hypothetical protein
MTSAGRTGPALEQTAAISVFDIVVLVLVEFESSGLQVRPECWASDIAMSGTVAAHWHREQKRRDCGPAREWGRLRNR